MGPAPVGWESGQAGAARGEKPEETMPEREEGSRRVADVLQPWELRRHPPMTATNAGTWTETARGEDGDHRGEGTETI